MTAEQSSLDAQLAASAQDRDKLLATLAREATKSTAKRQARFRVVRQRSNQADEHVCGHRFELLAELCAYRHVMRHRAETGGHYTVRRADA